MLDRFVQEDNLVTLYNREHILTINYDFSLNKILIGCLLTVSKVVVTVCLGVGLRDLKHSHAK